MKPNEIHLIRKAVIAASGQILTRHLPDDYYEMSEDDLDDFILTFVTEDYEEWSADDVWEEIDSMTQAFLNFYKSL